MEGQSGRLDQAFRQLLARIRIIVYAFLLLPASASSAASIDEARKHMDAGRLADAEDVVGSLLVDSPNWAEAHYLMGLARFRMGRLEVSIQ